MEGLITVVAVKNPFDAAVSRQVRRIAPGMTVREMVADSFPDGIEAYDLKVGVDGLMLTDQAALDFVPPPGAFVSLCPVPQGGGGGKNPLLMIAAIALVVVAPQISFAMVSGLGFVSFPLLEMAFTIGILAVGGMVINSLAKVPDVPGVGTFENSPTYGWEPGQNTDMEGIVAPDLFGTCRFIPPVIGKYVETSGDKQYLNILFLVAGHRLTSLSSVRINGTDEASYPGVDIETRLGSDTQPVLQNFGDTRFEVADPAKLNPAASAWSSDETYATDAVCTYENQYWKSLQDGNLNNTPSEGPGWWTAEIWATRTTTGNLVEGFGVSISLPKGLYYANDAGGVDVQTVKVRIEYSLHGAEDWTPLQVKTTEAITVSGTRWSAGFWKRTNILIRQWVEIEAGSATYSDHLEGDPYTVAEWSIIQDALGLDDYARQPTFWRWTSGNILSIGSVERDYAEIKGSQTSPIHRIYYKDGLTPGQYDIRCRLVEALPSTARYGNETWFQGWQEIVYDDFTYPGETLMAVRALATDQLSGGIPRIDVLGTAADVPVWNGSAYVDKPSNNPAWASYHVLHRARRLDDGVTVMAAGVKKERMLYAPFAEWAAWCDEKGYTFNHYQDQPMSVSKILTLIGANGRGSAVQVGSKFSCLFDKPHELPTQRFLFTMGNINKDSFGEQFLPNEDRANSVEVTWFDNDLGRQTVTLYAEDFDTTDRELNPVQITLFGCTSRDLAMKYGHYLLKSNRYLTITANWEADVDAIACQPHDVVLVAHDVPQWGYSGRILSANGAIVVLDREVTMVPGVSYVLQVRRAEDDALETGNVVPVAVSTTTDTITLTAPLEGASGGGFGGITDTDAGFGGTTDTLVGDGWGGQTELENVYNYVTYSFGEAVRVSKPFRLMKTSRAQDMRKKLVALEYVEEVYVDGADVPPPVQYSDLPLLSRLAATEVWRGGAETKACLTWYGFALFYNVWYRRQGGGWIYGGKAFRTGFEIGGLDYGVTYDFAVSLTESPEDGEIVSLQLRGKIDPPSDVATFTATVQKYGTLLSWSPVGDFDLAGYEIRLGSDWESAQTVYQGLATSYLWVIQAAGTYTLLVKAVDAFGNFSTNAASVITVVEAPPSTAVAYHFSGPNLVLQWTSVTGRFATEHYEIRYGNTWAGGTFVFNTKGTSSIHKVDWTGDRTYWVAAVDVAGNVGTASPVIVDVVSPGQVPTLTPEVIDNNVLLRWTAPTVGSLPIDYYEVRRGDTFAGADVIGRILSTFSVVFESQGGTYVYWIVPVDTAGNTGTERGATATVSQPPDYVLLTDWQSTLEGTLSSAIKELGRIILPVNTTETYTEHFTTPEPDWATPQAQIDAGYEIFIEPTPASGYHEETFDYEAQISVTTMITVIPSLVVLDGAPVLTCKISVSANGTDWTDYDDTFVALASDFRYVKVRLTASSAGGDDLLAITGYRVLLDLKEITDSGNATANSGDAGGTQVDFNVSFVDVRSIVVTPIGSAAAYAVVEDFLDVPNPTHFHVYLFDSTGTRMSGDFSWYAKGV